MLYRALGRHAEAEALYGRALAIHEKALGPEHPDTADSLNSLALAFFDLGRYAEAEPLLRRSLAIREKAFGPEHAEAATALANLGLIYGFQGRYTEAEPLYRRAVTISEKALGPEHPNTAVVLNDLAVLYFRHDRYAEADPLFRRVLAILEKVRGPEHPDTALSLDNVGEVHRIQGRYAEAEQFHRRALAIREKVLGPDHPGTAIALTNLARTYHAVGRYAEAVPFYRHALAIREKAFGPGHPDTALSLGNLGELRFKQRASSEAYDLLSRATAIHILRARRGGETVGRKGVDQLREEIDSQRWAFHGLVQAAASLAAAGPADGRLALSDHAFTTAQWAQRSAAATALASMAARSAKGDGPLAELVRQRQDLVASHRLLDRSLVAASAKPPGERKAADEAALRDKIGATENQIDAIDLQLKQRFPEYAAIANPEPLTIAEAQKHLRADEALLLVLVDDGKGRDWIKDRDWIVAWVVTRDAVQFQVLDLGAKVLAEHVEALRCGLDDAQWEEMRGRSA